MSAGFAPPTAALPTRVASRPERDLPRENCHEPAAPVPAVILAKVASDGGCSPRSSRAMTGCCMSTARANSVWVRPRSARYRAMRMATSRAKTDRSHASRNAGSSRWRSTTSCRDADDGQIQERPRRRAVGQAQMPG